MGSFAICLQAYCQGAEGPGTRTVLYTEDSKSQELTGPERVLS